MWRHERLIDIEKFIHTLPPEPYAVPALAPHSGVPFLFNTPVMVINRNLVRREIRNWDDLAEQIGNGEIILNLGTLPFFYHWIGDLEKNLSDPAAVEKLEASVKMLRRMQGEGVEIGGCRVPDEFINGQVPVYIAYSNYLQFLPEKLPFEYEIMLTPYADGIAPLAETIFNGISPECRAPVEAYLFIRFLASAEAQKIMAKYRYAMPTNREVLETCRREKYPKLDSDALAQSRFSLGISWWAIVNLENSNKALLGRGNENGLDDAAVVRLIQEQAAEYLMLDHLR
jgi:ABC-type glycerol-3-phosphate transport system substrate-binding protein